MKLRKRSLDQFVLIVGAVVFLSLMFLPKPGGEWSYTDTVKYAPATLKGQTPFSDFAAMVVGFRALYHGTDPYPVLGTAFKELGFDWDVRHGSNHPPTSYLLAAPVALFPWPVASAAWAWLMLCLIVLSYRLHGLSWKMALGLMPLTLLWTPASASLGQVTIVWMFGLALGYHFRRSKPFWSGVSVGLASASKYMPGLLMIAFLLKRRWAALVGFVSFWLASLAVVSLMYPAAVARYVEENRHTTFAIIERTDNAAPLLVGYRYWGWMGVASLLLFFSLIVFVNRRYIFRPKNFPSTRGWMLFSYFAVVCLPIFWVYSLMPLLPVIVFLLCRRRVVTSALALCALIIPAVFTRPGETSVLAIAGAGLFLGLAFITDVLPLKILRKRWGMTIAP